MTYHIETTSRPTQTRGAADLQSAKLALMDLILELAGNSPMTRIEHHVFVPDDPILGHWHVFADGYHLITVKP